MRLLLLLSVYCQTLDPGFEMMEIKTEPNLSDELYSDGEIHNMVDNNSMECVTESKMLMFFIHTY